ncbi:hydroxylase [Nocardiopsis terrae]|uniref:Enzyme related to lactoylglutathione lyase n=1 Tax=Nocardiopsis terrae TaxID=372655 RepID=A0ABR9H9Z9_9ACTN|nr:VOC family protein [Nocardiopsis terrae]MBE1455823.1 putative enzyme related to lactoylglutathione lyase [Nocardiopsis terrae]GHC92699.1 hydroxylase [Nocardiopsis terrae]
MITTDFVTGSPCWLDLGATDIEASADFYGRVFGWQAVSAGARMAGYRVMNSDGAAVAGIGPRIDEDEPPEWGVQFWVPDIEAAALRAQELGGTVLVEPTVLYEFGQLAHITDPQGGWFTLWQPGTFTSAQAVDRPNTLCWVELWTPSAQGAKEFYGGLFGWEFKDVELPGDQGTYSTVRPAGLGEDRYFGGLMDVAADQLPQAEGRADWHPVFQVADCDEAVAAVKTAGGRVHMGPEDAPGVGRLAVCSDPFSAGFVVLDPGAGRLHPEEGLVGPGRS